jgi:cell division protein FtsL
MKPNMIGTLIMLLAVISSSFGVVYAKHQNREFFIELQSLVNEKDMMETEWGQLQLEQSTLATHGGIEQSARTRLGMLTPDANDMVIVRP